MANKRTDGKYTSHLELFKHGEYSTLSSILGIRPKILKYRRVAQLAEQWIPSLQRYEHSEVKIHRL